MTEELTYTQKLRLNRLCSRYKFDLAAVDSHTEDDDTWTDEFIWRLNTGGIVGKVLGRPQVASVWASNDSGWLYDEEWLAVQEMMNDLLWVRLHEVWRRNQEETTNA